jgi:excisionase family DNA binding protein
MMDIPDKRYFRPDEVAVLIEESVRAVYYWLQKDRIKHLHHGRKTMIPREEVERIIQNGV